MSGMPDAPLPRGKSDEDSRVSRTRADIARATFDVLREHGWDELTHARIAERAGYSKTTLYSHWPARVDLVAMAIDALGEFPHHQPTGELRSDLIGELTVFRQAVIELRLDRILSGLAQSATAKEVAALRDQVNTQGQRPLRRLLAQAFSGARLEAAVSMLTGVVACPSLMFGDLPSDAVITAAVDMVLAARA
jgi:AcrR family transcriptional regulator